MLTFSPELISPPELVGGAKFIPAGLCMPDPGASRFDAPGLKREMKRMELDSFLLIEDEFSTISDAVTEAHFSSVPGFEYTREESSQGVMFGEIILRTRDGMLYGDHAALKPSFDMAADAAYELGAMMTVNQLRLHPHGHSSFIPLGVYRYEDGTYGLISRYEPAVRTQDGVFWNPDREPTEGEVNRALRQGAAVIGSAHRSGLVLRDRTAKNVAGDLVGPRHVDLPDLGRIYGQGVEDDLGTYLSSLTSRMDGADGSMYASNVREHFVPTYQDIVRAPGSLVPQDARFSNDHIVHLHR